MGFTAKKSMKLVIVGGAVAAIALLSACSGNNVAGQGSPVKDAAAVKSAPKANQGGAGGASGGDRAGDVNCSKGQAEYQTGRPGGPLVDVITMETAAGNPGCVEAWTVFDEYFKKAPQGEGDVRRVRNISGPGLKFVWDCEEAPEPQGSRGIVQCSDKTGMRMRTAPGADSGTVPEKKPAPQRKFPNTTQTVAFTGWDAKEYMATFKLMQFQPGGANNGHWVEVPGDTKTYRLPLDAHSETYSALDLCSGGTPTVDSNGRGTKWCDQDDLVKALKGDHPPLAEIKVDRDDQITSVKEIYTP
ncbi:hypothetical protein [Amycolatopsis jejuensis]|uniref:hypothetical protein n=1 Tax=Amycolatopsis jejuensis TaxID=330084 RepID=UPI000525F5FC|nr:hypothetical protein [Amycolatopsis jejuensis]